MKVHFVLQSLQDNDIDVACITESWLSREQGHNHTIATIESLGYNISFTSRSKQRGGGVAFLLKSKLQFVEIKPQGRYTSFEWHGIQICGSNSKYRLLCIYRKQKISMIVFLEEFEHFLSLFCTNTTDEVIILGDFNVHFNSPDKYCCDMVDLLERYGLSQSVTDPTRISGYTLDLVFSNPYSLPLQCQVSEEMAKTTAPQIKFDHFPVTFKIADEFHNNTSSKKTFVKSFRKINQIDLNSFNELLEEKLTNSLEESSDTFQNCLETYNQCLSSTLHQFAPLQTKSVVKSSNVPLPPWMDLEYRKERSVAD